MFVIVGQRPGLVSVIEKGSDREVAGGFSSVEDARDWINGNECHECGGLRYEEADCPVPHFADGRGSLPPKRPIGCQDDELPVDDSFEPEEDTPAPAPFVPPTGKTFSFDD